MAERVHFIHGQPVIAITTGQPFNYLDPDPDTLHLDDIAESLAKDARYTGKTPGVFYSVAEHSVLCSRYVSEEHALMALMHDSAEAFIGDITSPLKKILKKGTTLKEIERRITKAIFKKFRIEPYSSEDPISPEVHDVDQYVYLQERYQICHPDANLWWDYHGDPDPNFPKIQCYEWRMAKHLFIKRFNELFYGLGNRKITS